MYLVHICTLAIRTKIKNTEGNKRLKTLLQLKIIFIHFIYYFSFSYSYSRLPPNPHSYKNEVQFHSATLV